MTVSCIAAMAENRVIGSGGALPWRLPSDLAHFKRITMGHAVIMGRRTWESIGRPLPGRRSVVITRRRDYAVPEGVTVAASLDEALERCRGEEEVFVIGGGEVYAQAVPRSDRIHLTVVHADVPGDVFFPELDPEEWALIREEFRPPDQRNPYAHSFRVLERVRGPSGASS